MLRRPLLPAALVLAAAVAAVLVASTLMHQHPPPSALGGVRSWGAAPPKVLVVSRDVCLEPGDRLEVVVPKALGAFKGVEASPQGLFSVGVAEERGGLLVVSLRVGRDAAERRGLVEGRVLVSVARSGRSMLLERGFYAYLGCNSAPVLRSEALELIFRNSSFVEAWHWYIRAPHDLGHRLFIAPRLGNFTILRSYLSLEMFVKKVVPRGGVWWPLSNYGPSAIGRSIDDVLEVEELSDHYLLNVSLWPRRANGVTVAYSGFVKGVREGGLVRYVFRLGFTSPLELYIVAPRGMVLKEVSVPPLGSLGFSACPYAPPGYVCYHARIREAILSTYSLELLFGEGGATS